MKWFKNKLKSCKKKQIQEIPTRYLYTRYDRDYRNKFHGIDADKIDPSVFSTRLRSLLVHSILNNVEIRYQPNYSNGTIKNKEVESKAIESNTIYFFKGFFLIFCFFF